MAAQAQQFVAIAALVDEIAGPRRDLAGLKLVIGACRTDAPIVPTGALSGRFEWTCERGRIEGELLLAPTDPAAIQELQLAVAS